MIWTVGILIFAIGFYRLGIRRGLQIATAIVEKKLKDIK